MFNGASASPTAIADRHGAVSTTGSVHAMATAPATANGAANGAAMATGEPNLVGAVTPSGSGSVSGPPREIVEDSGRENRTAIGT